MKVFISWSGAQSRFIASQLRDLLPQVIQAIKPFMSDDDIGAGDRWPNGLNTELEATDFGILCLTPENLSAPWLLYEAGALSKSLDKAKVCPLLFGMTFDDIKWPLAQFQSNLLDREGIENVIKSINLTVGEQQLSESQLDRSFTRVWPEFETMINTVPTAGNKKETTERPDREILNEILSLLRTKRREENTIPTSRSAFISLDEYLPASHLIQSILDETKEAIDRINKIKNDSLQECAIVGLPIYQSIVHQLIDLESRFSGRNWDISHISSALRIARSLKHCGDDKSAWLKRLSTLIDALFQITNDAGHLRIK